MGDYCLFCIYIKSLVIIFGYLIQFLQISAVNEAVIIVTDKFQIGLLTIDLHLAEAQSLKAKRQVIKSIKDRLKNRNNISIAEYGAIDKWQSAKLVICTVSNNHRHIEQNLQSIINQIDNWRLCEITQHKIEFL